jgi:7,8-dihydropterin-6-yl-methyl-4-(beta-D-ribofuranosyl)aminobenzene 5'-phosphate synthase
VKEVDSVRISTVCENHVDFLLPNVKNATRAGLAFQFDPKHGPLKADNGISFHVEAHAGPAKRNVLFEVGFSKGILLHNMNLMDLDPKGLDAILISHGHPDHCGTIEEVLEAVGRPIAINMHSDAFYPRYVVLADGTTIGPYNYMILNRTKLEQLGAIFVNNKTAMPLSQGVWASGEIERKVAFEPNRTVDPITRGGLYYVKDGEFVEDTVPDDQALYINLKGKGLIVLSGCAHAGIINTIEYARKVTGVKKIHAVLGGTHLGFPGVPEEKVGKTIEALKEIDPDIIVPMHCTGFSAIARMMRELNSKFIFNVAGTVFDFPG